MEKIIDLEILHASNKIPLLGIMPLLGTVTSTEVINFIKDKILYDIFKEIESSSIHAFSNWMLKNKENKKIFRCSFKIDCFPMEVQSDE